MVERRSNKSALCFSSRIFPNRGHTADYWIRSHRDAALEGTLIAARIALETTVLLMRSNVRI